MAAIHPMRTRSLAYPALLRLGGHVPSLARYSTLSYSIIIAIAVLVCCFLCSQLFTLPLANSLQLVNHYFTLLIFSSKHNLTQGK